MTLQRYIFASLTAALLGTVLAGCQTGKSVAALEGGYEEVSHPQRDFIAMNDPQPARVSFEYKGTNDTAILIWPALYGSAEIINTNIAIFVGDKAYTDPERVTHPRLFAVKSPALPLDITDEVLREWCAATGRNLKIARDRLNFATPEDENGDLALHLDFSTTEPLSHRDTWPTESILRLTWDQVDGIMKKVKATGTRKQDLRWGTPYIGEKP